MNILDIQDGFLGAQAKVDEWKEEAERRFYAPVQDMVFGGMWRGLPLEVKEQLRTQVPDAVKQMEEKYGG